MALFAIPGAAEPDNPDPLYRGLTSDQVSAIAAQARAFRDNPANLGQVGDAGYARIINEGRQRAADNLAVQEQLQRQQEQSKALEQEQVAKQQKQYLEQQKLQQDLQVQALDALRKSREEAKANVPLVQGQLGEQLLTQEQQAYQKLAPLLENRLNQLGLLQSGALPQAQARSQQELEQQRQNALQQFGLNAAQQLDINFPLQLGQDTMALLSQATGQNIGQIQQNLASNLAGSNQAYRDYLNTQLGGLSRQFSLEDASQRDLLARQLQQDQLNAQRQSQPGLGDYLSGAGIGIGSDILGGVLGGAGGVFGGSLAKLIGNYINPQKEAIQTFGVGRGGVRTDPQSYYYPGMA